MSNGGYRFQPKNQECAAVPTQAVASAPSPFTSQRREWPQQQERKDRRYTSGPQDYQKWKKQDEKQKPLTADDFPPLGSNAANPVIRPTAEPKGPSLAERLRVTIAKEEEEATQRRFRKDDPPEDKYETITTLNLGRLYQSRANKKREEEATQRRAAEEQDEKDYQWQVSKAIVRELEEPEAEPVDSQEDMSCFPADDEDNEDTVRPTTPLYR